MHGLPPLTAVARPFIVNEHGPRQRSRPPVVLHARPRGRHLAGDAREPRDLPARVKERVAPDRAFRGLPAAIPAAAGELTARPEERPGCGPVPGRARPVPLHGQRLPLRAVQGRPGDGAGVRAGLDHRRRGSPTPARSRTSWPRSPGRGVSPSIQTAPLAFRPNVTDGGVRRPGSPASLLRVVAHLVDLEARTGRRVKLALEPEPACYLESTAGDGHVLRRARCMRRGRGPRAGRDSPGSRMSEAEGLLRRHLGVVFDIGHQSVGFEDIARLAASAGRRRRPDLQAAGGGRALGRGAHPEQVVPDLRAFTDTIYLSQTTMRRGGAG